MAASLIDSVSDTAFWVAHYRGLEGERADALFQDPLAARLSGDHGKQIARSMPGANFTSWAVVMRTCLIDDYIRFAIDGGVDTVINLGAGLDTRPYRMELSGSLTWLEVDYPAVIALKEERLRQEVPRCRLARLAADLANETEREKMLSRANASARKMLVITEGVVPYLSEGDVASLAQDLRSLDRVAYWIVDYFSPMAIKYRKRRMKGRMENAPFKFEPEDWFGFFERHGWRCKEMRYLAEEAERRKRPLEHPWRAKLFWAVRSLFLSKEERDSFRKLAGYGLLEPIERRS